MQLVKVQYYSHEKGDYTGREYTYYSEENLEVGNIVVVPAKDGTSRARVSNINVPEAEIAAFKDKVKIIPAGALMPIRLPMWEEIDLVEPGAPVPVTAALIEQATPPQEEFEKTNALITVEQETEELSTEIFNVKEISTPELYNQAEKWLSNIRIKLQDHEKKRVADVKKPNDYVRWLNMKYKTGAAMLQKAEQHVLTILGEYRKKKEAERKAEQDRLDAIAKRAFEKKQQEEADARRREAEAREREEVARKAEEEARRQAEVAKNEAERKKAEEEARRQAEVAKKAEEEAKKAAIEANKKASAIPVPFARKVESEVQSTTDTGGAKNIWGETWHYEIVDLEKFRNEAPKEAMIPDPKFLKDFADLYKAKAVMPGVRFFPKDKVQVRRAKGGASEEPAHA